LRQKHPKSHQRHGSQRTAAKAVKKAVKKARRRKDAKLAPVLDLINTLASKTGFPLLPSSCPEICAKLFFVIA
jgi:hypothetical protein